jgi:SAM-dependent methyltransferase
VTTSREAPAEELKAEFRKGFHPRRPAHWVEQIGFQDGPAEPRFEYYLDALKAGERDFAYPGHDAAVLDALKSLVASRGLRLGADVGCATGCFPAMQLAAGIERCTVFEVRPLRIEHPRIELRQQDLSQEPSLAGTFDVVTCLSTVEHVGLGRYGDPLDPWGDLKLARNLRGLLRPGGILLMSFPVGTGCVVFNRHRIYSRTRRDSLLEGWRLLRVVSGMTPVRRLRYELSRAWLGRVGIFRQPIFVLEA